VTFAAVRSNHQFTAAMADTVTTWQEEDVVEKVDGSRECSALFWGAEREQLWALDRSLVQVKLQLLERRAAAQ
jgi:hypothetical protein